MAAPPVLLVADDLAIIASVKRVLAREGYECVLATNAADAVIAFGHMLPGLLILQPSVERDRGGILLEELQLHPDAQLLRVVILGETVPGFAWPVVPLPLDPEHFAGVIAENIRTTDEAASWSVLETAPPASPPAPHELPHEPEAWRATPPHESELDPAAATDDVPEPQAIVEEPRPLDLEDKLFGDLAADIEAEAMQSVDASLPRPQEREDEELDRLEAEVRAEAQRRREARESEAVAVKPARPTPPPPSSEETARFPAEDAAEQSFESLSDAPPAPPSRAAAVLARAEQMVFESRAQAEAGQRVDDAELRLLRQQLETATRQALDSEAAVVALQEQLQQRDADLETERELARVRHENALEAQQHEAAAALEVEAKRRAEAEQALAAEREQRLASEQRLDDVTAQLTAATTEAGSLAQVAAELEGTKKRVADLQAELTGWEEMATSEEARRGEAEAQLAERTAAAARLEERVAQLEAADVQATSRRQELEAMLAAREERLAALTTSIDEERATRGTLEARVIELESKTDAAQSTRAELEQEVVQAETLLTEARQQHEELQGRLTSTEQQRAELVGEVSELSLALQTARADAEAAMALANEGAEAERSRRAETQGQLEVLERQLAETKAARDAAQAELLQAEQARDAANAQVGELQSRLEGLLADVTSTSALAEETARERDALRSRVGELEPLRPLAEALEQELATTRRALEDAKTQLDAVEASATLAGEKVKQLEAREVLPISVGKHALGVARHGTVPLEGLARVVSQLVIGNAEVRLELGVSGGTRTLWFRRGQIVAAESSVELEGLIARARRDGLIDARQDAELRMLKGATPREQLEALKSRGFIRDIESVPLVQRYTEQVALDGFTEAETTYRIVEEAPGPEVLLATVPRPTLPMLAESLRRAVSPDAMLEQLGGGEAVPVATDSELDLRALGFSERERKMLSWVDGEATVEDLSLASGLKPDLAFRALLVAQLLGVVQVKPGTKKLEPSAGQLDLQRLEAKYDEVQDADYFTILGLSRAAGSEDVRRAFQRLTQEFDPLRFSGHPDPQVQQHAQVVANLLEEAARALEDDRRRVEYARHLLD